MDRNRVVDELAEISDGVGQVGRHVVRTRAHDGTQTEQAAVSLDQVGHVDGELARLLVLIACLDRAQLLKVALQNKRVEKTFSLQVRQTGKQAGTGTTYDQVVVDADEVGVDETGERETRGETHFELLVDEAVDDDLLDGLALLRVDEERVEDAIVLKHLDGGETRMPALELDHFAELVDKYVGAGLVHVADGEESAQYGELQLSLIHI